VNLAAQTSINKIVIDNTGSPGDYPRIYKVETSTDKNTWTTAVGPTTNTIDGEITIPFTARTAQYVRITQTGRALDRFWSITELNVFGSGSTSSPVLAEVNVGTATGSSSLNNGIWTVTSAGQDIYNAPDNFRFVHQTASGNYRITAKVKNMGNAISWARAGVMIRDDNGTGPNYAMVCVTPGYGIKFQSRSNAPQVGSSLQDVSASSPDVWLKLEKTGTTYTGWSSTDGTNWSAPKSAVISNMNTHSIGIVSSGNGGLSCTATISDVKIEQIP
jgi:regulation of enolase protein 1 (concanavalin A-like superfamily)